MEGDFQSLASARRASHPPCRSSVFLLRDCHFVTPLAVYISWKYLRLHRSPACIVIILTRVGHCCNIALVSVGIGTIQDYHRFGNNLCRLLPRFHLCHHFPSRRQRPLFQASVKEVAAVAAAGHHHRLRSDPFEKAPTAPVVVVRAAPLLQLLQLNLTIILSLVQLFQWFG